jgi:serine acetyltransferase
MNILVRLASSRLPFVCFFCNSLLFYLYGSTISLQASLHAPIRFSHARSVVIGGNVCFSFSDFVYIFNNVTIGKASPAVRDRAMPTFMGRSFFGVGSVVLGSVLCEGDVVFGANSFISNTIVPSYSTVVGHSEIKNGVFFGNLKYPFVPLRPYRLFTMIHLLLSRLKINI